APANLARRSFALAAEPRPSVCPRSLTVAALFRMLLCRDLKQPAGRFRPKAVGKVIEEHGQEKVKHQDGNERQHEGLRGGPADSFGAGSRVEAAMTTNERDRSTEEDRLDQSGGNIPGPHHLSRTFPVEVGFDVIDLSADQ